MTGPDHFALSSGTLQYLRQYPSRRRPDRIDTTWQIPQQGEEEENIETNTIVHIYRRFCHASIG
jgi:hypothetical protein